MSVAFNNNRPIGAGPPPTLLSVGTKWITPGIDIIDIIKFGIVHPIERATAPLQIDKSSKEYEYYTFFRNRMKTHPFWSQLEVFLHTEIFNNSDIQRLLQPRQTGTRTYKYKFVFNITTIIDRLAYYVAILSLKGPRSKHYKLNAVDTLYISLLTGEGPSAAPTGAEYGLQMFERDVRMSCEKKCNSGRLESFLHFSNFKAGVLHMYALFVFINKYRKEEAEAEAEDEAEAEANAGAGAEANAGAGAEANAGAGAESENTVTTGNDDEMDSTSELLHFGWNDPFDERMLSDLEALYGEEHTPMPMEMLFPISPPMPAEMLFPISPPMPADDDDSDDGEGEFELQLLERVMHDEFEFKIIPPVASGIPMRVWVAGKHETVRVVLNRVKATMFPDSGFVASLQVPSEKDIALLWDFDFDAYLDMTFYDFLETNLMREPTQLGGGADDPGYPVLMLGTVLTSGKTEVCVELNYNRARKLTCGDL